MKEANRKVRLPRYPKSSVYELDETFFEDSGEPGVDGE